MSTTFTTYTLPEFVFLDGHSHLGDQLQGRTVLQHVRSYTIVEVVALDETIASSFHCRTHRFSFTNHFGITETHLLALHFTVADDDDIEGIFEKCASWYCQYLAWEDSNIMDSETSKFN